MTLRRIFPLLMWAVVATAACNNNWGQDSNESSAPLAPPPVSDISSFNDSGETNVPPESLHLPSLAPRNPAFIRYVASQRGSHTLSGYVRPTGYIPPPILPVASQPSTLKFESLETLPRAFDWREVPGHLPPVHDQGNCGSCWAFPACGVAEIQALPDVTLDFSEHHMINSHAFGSGPCDGGNAFKASSYYLRRLGPIAESTDPYDDTGLVASPTDATPDYWVRQTLFLPNRASSADNDVLKNAIIQYGGVSTDLYMIQQDDPDYAASFNPTTNALYYQGSADLDHSVVLVGFDDDFPSSRFAVPPPGDGAFIARNSWGPSWGEAGYFYISYYDSMALTGNIVWTDVVAASKSSLVVTNSPFGATDSVGCNNEVGFIGGMYHTQDAMRIFGVSSMALTPTTQYQVSIFVNVNAANGSPTSGTLVRTSSGVAEYGSYWYLSLEGTPVDIPANTTYSVIIKMQSDGYNWPMPIENNLDGFLWNATGEPGRSFVSCNAQTWFDVTSLTHSEDFDPDTADVVIFIYGTPLNGCVPSCDGKECGDDGCGGSCGSCEVGEVCLPSHDCCSPDCEGRACGHDGCGGTCGLCPEGFACGQEGMCLECSCGNRQCGSDDCGQPCGTCAPGLACTDGQCVEPPTECITSNSSGCLNCECEACVCSGLEYCCSEEGRWDDICVKECASKCGGPDCSGFCFPDCSDRVCGDDGCGGTCGSCDDAEYCSVGGRKCLACGCGGKECGEDGCGASCGTCEDGAMCMSGSCIPKGCGQDEHAGCDGCACEACVCNQDSFCCEVEWDSICAALCASSECMGNCPVCIRSCEQKECGDDGCGGQCGTCASDEHCVEGTCLGSYPESCLGSSEPSAPTCNPGLTYAGCCDELGRIVWCGPNGKLYCIDCGKALEPSKLTCGWVPFGSDGTPADYYGCGGFGDDPQGLYPLSCGDVICNSDCTGADCGDDGCGGSCGTCSDNAQCTDRKCVVPCVQACTGAECGDDGCGGSCGTCSDNATCIDHKCIVPCAPACNDAECGDDGCGGWCGTCSGNAICADHKCIVPCAPACNDVECGDDGCGGSCGTCSGNATCIDHKCLVPCVPVCNDAECGDDGCGGSCGTCSGNATCIDHECVVPCVPVCNDAECGDDGCGGSCGTCPDGSACLIGKCMPTCTPHCEDAQCGDDGCGGLCGLCPNGTICKHGKCQVECLPDCGTAECGDDGCGGSCGTCQEHFGCSALGRCECLPDCLWRQCGEDGCGGSCGSCGQGSQCQDGSCNADEPDARGDDSEESVSNKASAGGCSASWACPSNTGNLALLMTWLVSCVLVLVRRRLTRCPGMR